MNQRTYSKKDFCVITPVGGDDDGSAAYLDEAMESCRSEGVVHLVARESPCPMLGRVAAYVANPRFAYYIWLDSDDRLTMGSVEAFVNAANANPGAVYMHGGFCLGLSGRVRVMPYSRKLIGRGQCPSPPHCLSAEFMQRVADADFPVGRMGLNYWVLSRLLKPEDVIATTPEAIANIRIHANSRTVKNHSATIEDMLEWRKTVC